MADLAGEAARGRGWCLTASRKGEAEKCADLEGLIEADLDEFAGSIETTGWLTDLA